MYDVIVVGGRCAGSPTAMLFARAGFRTLLVDRVRFPRDTVSTLYIHQPGTALLNRWGLLDSVRATGCPPIDHAIHQVGDVRFSGCAWPVDGIREALAPRRYLLDEILWNAAGAAGAECEDAVPVTDIVIDEGRVVGVRLAGRIERARLVVGADGMRSTVAAAVGAGYLSRHPKMTCVYYTYFEGVDAGFEVYNTSGRWVGSVPTNDGLTLVASYFPQSEFAAIRTNSRQALLDSVAATAPQLYQRLRDGRSVDRIFGSGDQRNYLRAAAGQGWALVGDAGHHKDSITGKGITDAFRQADLLVDCVREHFDDRLRMQAALRRYESARNELVMDGYRDTLTAARLRPERRTRLMQAMADDPALTERFFATLAGASPSSELVDREFIARHV
ncbi:FAD-dependent oxidoreductase [Nocardia sp. CA-128927]|uniref:FAD-dependent oxidoreductase n=1 Tax=Nocardia sp. CA-128927 TaxID=3239975 RepID=UPI003D95D0BB